MITSAWQKAAEAVTRTVMFVIILEGFTVWLSARFESIAPAMFKVSSLMRRY